MAAISISRVKYLGGGGGCMYMRGDGSGGEGEGEAGAEAEAGRSGRSPPYIRGAAWSQQHTTILRCPPLSAAAAAAMPISPSSLSTALLLVLPALSLLQLAAAGPAEGLPSYIRVCKRNDPNLGECVMNSIENMRPQLMTGMPELNVPSIEPLFVKNLDIRPSSGLHIQAHDFQVNGGSNFKLNNLEIQQNDTDVRFDVQVDFALLTLAGHYTIDGHIFMLPVKGDGHFEGNVTDIKGDLEMKGKITEHNGEEYLRFNEAASEVKIQGPLHYHFDNLFNGDKALGDATNAALAENSEELKNMVESVAAAEVAKFALEVSNNVVEEFPLRMLFPKE